MNRTVALTVVLALYIAVLGRGPMGRLFGRSGFDPLAPRPAAVEQLIVAGRFDEALPLARALRAGYPDEPLVSYWLATINHRLARWQDEADAWADYVRTSAAPREACPAWHDALARSGDDVRARTAAARCEEMMAP
jgi:predicted Zn-dependent protease